MNGMQESIKFVVYNGRKYIVDGNNRILAARKLGMREVPATRVSLPYGSYRTHRDLVWSRQ